MSSQYLGARAPEPVKKMVLEMVYSWTVNLPDETKICDAYQMLKKQGESLWRLRRFTSEDAAHFSFFYPEMYNLTAALIVCSSPTLYSSHLLWLIRILWLWRFVRIVYSVQNDATSLFKDYWATVMWLFTCWPFYLVGFLNVASICLVFNNSLLCHSSCAFRLYFWYIRFPILQ